MSCAINFCLNSNRTLFKENIRFLNVKILLAETSDKFCYLKIYIFHFEINQYILIRRCNLCGSHIHRKFNSHSLEETNPCLVISGGGVHWSPKPNSMLGKAFWSETTCISLQYHIASGREQNMDYRMFTSYHKCN
jgi:hypothetical protein